MFNEKNEEWSKKQQKNIQVLKTQKYEEAKAKAIELIEGKKYDLTEGDFWILMNETKTGKMQYTGLIISHNGCLKINDKLENKFKTDCVTLDKEGFNHSLVYTYIDGDVYEIGEVSKENCLNAYPYAMAFKRCFDRVVLKKSKLAYAGVYSDSEADEFSGKDIEEEQKETDKLINETMEQSLRELISNLSIPNEDVIKALARLNCTKIKELKYSQVQDFRKHLGAE